MAHQVKAEMSGHALTLPVAFQTSQHAVVVINARLQIPMVVGKEAFLLMMIGLVPVECLTLHHASAVEAARLRKEVVAAVVQEVVHPLVQVIGLVVDAVSQTSHHALNVSNVILLKMGAIKK